MRPCLTTAAISSLWLPLKTRGRLASSAATTGQRWARAAGCCLRRMGQAGASAGRGGVAVAMGGLGKGQLPGPVACKEAAEPGSHA